MEHVRTIMIVTFVNVTVVLKEQTVKQLIIAITRTVLFTAYVTTNTTRTNVHVVRDTQVLTVSILTVTKMDANMAPPVSMDTLTTRVDVYQDIKGAYAKHRTFVIIRIVQEKGLVIMKNIITCVIVLPDF